MKEISTTFLTSIRYLNHFQTYSVQESEIVVSRRSYPVYHSEIEKKNIVILLL